MPPAATRERLASCRLRRDPAQVGHARRLVRESLARWGLYDHIDYTVLIISKLVTNALRHGAGTITIQLSRVGHHLRIEVHDHGPGRPVRRHAGTGDEGGRGLEVIDGLISMHDGHRGCTDDDTGPGKTVYVAMSLTASETGHN
jgi:anti-sigma regulatory factor (Ser/Thr protein kinase)